MPTHGTGQHATLDILPNRPQFCHMVAMADTVHVLLNNWSLVKVGCDIMRGGTNQFDALFIGLAVWISTDKGWQE